MSNNNSKIKVFGLKLFKKKTFIINKILRSIQVYLLNTFYHLLDLYYYINNSGFEKFQVRIFISCTNINIILRLLIRWSKKFFIIKLFILFFIWNLSILLFIIFSKIFKLVIIVIFVSVGCFFLAFFAWFISHHGQVSSYTYYIFAV